jgi:ABC-2 type transport system ATP-binding protein
MISSQHLHEVEAVADNILFLEEGSVVYNGPIGGLGEARACNTFELDSPLDLKALEERLKDIADTIYFNGVSYVITTAVGVDRSTFLNTLLEKDVEIDYFRDISRSIKQLFSKASDR